MHSTTTDYTTTVLRIGRRVLSTPEDLLCVVNTIVRDQYPILVVAALGASLTEPNMTDLLIALSHNTIKGTPDHEVPYQGTIVQMPLVRLNAFASTLIVDDSIRTALIEEFASRFAWGVSQSGAQYIDPYVSCGEYCVALLISSMLKERGLEYPVLEPERFLRSDGSYGIDIPASKKILRTTEYRTTGLKRFIVPGYYSGDEQGAITLLARDGTNITAIAIAALFEKHHIENLSTLRGIAVVDPLVVPDTHIIPVVSLNELMELNRTDLQEELHPKALSVMQTYGISIRIRSFDSASTEGTLVTHMDTSHPDERLATLTGIGYESEYTLLCITSRTFAPYGELEKACALFAEMKISLPYTSSTMTNMSFVYKTSDVTNLIAGVFKRLWPHAQVIYEPCDVICVVGNGMARKPGTAAAILAALAERSINIKALASTGDEHKIAIVIDAGIGVVGVRGIYESCFASGIAL